MSPDQKRLRFIQRIQTLSSFERVDALRVETDAELVELKRVALDLQWFELAAEIVEEVTRRTFEIPT